MNRRPHPPGGSSFVVPPSGGIPIALSGADPMLRRWPNRFPFIARETARRVALHNAPPVAELAPRAGWRTFARPRLVGVLTIVLCLLPVFTYWPTIFSRYGFRDDYSILREAHEEPATVVRVCAMQARPFYGELLETSFQHVRNIGELAWIRLLAAALLGAVGAAFFLSLRRLKLDRWTAALTGALLVLVPSSQMLVSWAVAWPRCVALLSAIGAFHAAETAFVDDERTRGGWWTSAVLLLVMSALIYPSDTLLYLTLVAAALWSRRRWTPRHALRWLVRHLVTLLIGLDVAFTGMTVAFAHGWLLSSTRVAFDGDWLAKLTWFVREPLQDALSVIVLNHDGGSRVVHRFAALIGFIVVAGLLREATLRWRRSAPWWSVALLLLIPASFGVNLVAADRWAAYRVLLPLTMTVAVALALALLTLGGRMAARFGLLMLVIPAVWLAREQTFRLIAVPQSIELKALESGAAQIDPARHERVFILTPSPEDHVGRTVYRDEFGSLSTDSDWVPKEMLKLAMKEQHPVLPDVARRYAVATGRALPSFPPPDVVIDLRHLGRVWLRGALARIVLHACLRCNTVLRTAPWMRYGKFASGRPREAGDVCRVLRAMRGNNCRG